MATQWWKIFEDVFIRLEFMNVTWQLDRQTDGQTDGRTDKPWWHRPRLHSIMRQLYTIVVLILKSIFFCYVVNVWNSLSANVTEFEFLSHFQWSLHKIDFGAFYLLSYYSLYCSYKCYIRNYLWGQLRMLLWALLSASYCFYYCIIFHMLFKQNKLWWWWWGRLSAWHKFCS